MVLGRSVMLSLSPAALITCRNMSPAIALTEEYKSVRTQTEKSRRDALGRRHASAIHAGGHPWRNGTSLTPAGSSRHSFSNVTNRTQSSPHAAATPCRLSPPDSVGTGSFRNLQLHAYARLRRGGALIALGPTRQHPVRPGKMTGIAAGVALEIVLMLRLGLPKFACRRDFRHHLAGP